jgi:hypothetical protein
MDHQFKSIPELLNYLNHQLAALEGGKLSSSELDKLVGSAREVYERLLVVRHKAYEKITKASNATVVNEPMASIIETSFAADNVTKKPEAFRLNFAPRQNDLTKNQISLIDSIEEINKQQTKDLPSTKTLHERLVSEVEVSTLGEKLERLPISDLKKAIGLNQKFVFINELFNKDHEIFETTLLTINNFSSAIEADNFINNNLKARFNWDTSNENVKDFFELVERRFL